MKQNLKRRLFIIFAIIMFIFILYISVFYKPADQKAYNEVVATMSMEKAKFFFQNHSTSPYADILVNEIIEWCNQEKTEECYRIALETIPKDHIKYHELSAYYGNNFKADN